MNQHKHSLSPWTPVAYAPWMQAERPPAGTEHIASVHTSEGRTHIYAPYAHAEARNGNKVLILAAPRMFETLLELAVILDESNETQRNMYDLVYGALKEAGWEDPAATPAVCPCCGAPRA